jgi:hypothetical protein
MDAGLQEVLNLLLCLDQKAVPDKRGFEPGYVEPADKHADFEVAYRDAFHRHGS